MTPFSSSPRKPRNNLPFTAMRFLNFLFLTSLVLAGVAAGQQTPYSAATISGVNARNIGSATMSGRVAALAANRESSGKLTIFVGAARGGVVESGERATPCVA